MNKKNKILLSIIIILALVILIPFIKATINFVNTQSNGANVSQTYIYAEINSTGLNLANITFNLYDYLNSLVNSSLNTSLDSINWTGLTDGIYYYNATTYNSSNSYDATETRKITLDTYAPNITAISPLSNITTNILWPNYLSNNLTNYWDMNSGIATIGIVNFTGSTYVNSTLCLKGGCYNYTATEGIQTDTTLPNIFNSYNLTYNYWVYNNDSISGGNCYHAWVAGARVSYGGLRNTAQYYNAFFDIGGDSPINLSDFNNKWAMVTWVRNDTSAIIYVNGQIIRNDLLVTTSNDPGTLYLGDPSYTGGCVGYFDEISYWNGRALNQTEILVLYNNGTGITYNEQNTTINNISYFNNPNVNISWNVSEYVTYDSYSSLAQGLIAYYPLENNSDVSGNGLNLNNRTGTYASGKIGNALSNDWIYGQGSQFNDIKLNGTDDYSVCLWTNNTDGASQGIFGITDTVGEYNFQGGVGMSHANVGTQWQLYRAEGNDQITNTASRVGWQYHCLVSNLTGFYYYRNAVLISSVSPVNTTYNSPQVEFFIGSQRDDGDAQWSGQIDELGVWNRQLSSDEITELYNSSNGMSYPFNAVSIPINGSGIKNTTLYVYNESQSLLFTSASGLWEDILSYYPLDNSGKDTYRNYDLIATGIPEYRPDGKIAEALNGTDPGFTNYFQVNRSAHPVGTNGTINFWIYKTHSSVEVIMADKDSNAAGDIYLNDNIVSWQMSPSPIVTISQSPACVNLSTWTMITLTYNESSTSFYCDGLLSNTINVQRNMSDNEWNIGRDQGTASPNQFYDEISFFDRQLNDSEISQLYNSGAGLRFQYNSYTTINTPGNGIISVIVNFMDGIYTWFADVFDFAGNKAITQNNSFIVDTVYPLIDYTGNTEQSGVNKSQGNIFVEVTINDDYLNNVTFNLYSNSLINTTTLDSSFTSINWTNLNNGTYYYNVTACDLANNCNSTETRRINLDTAIPIINIISPTNGTTIGNSSVTFTWNVSDIYVGPSEPDDFSEFTLFENYLTPNNLNGEVLSSTNVSYQSFTVGVTGSNQTFVVKGVEIILSGSDLNNTIYAYIYNSTNLTGCKFNEPVAYGYHPNIVIPSGGFLALYMNITLTQTGILYQGNNYCLLIDAFVPSQVLWIFSTVGTYNGGYAHLPSYSPGWSTGLDTFFGIYGINVSNATYGNFNGTGITNTTLYIYNQSGIVNQTTKTNTDLTNILEDTISITIDLLDGIYTWFADVFDFSGNYAVTQNQTLNVENIPPNITFIDNATYPDGANVSSNSIFVEVNTSSSNINYLLYLNNFTNTTYCYQEFANVSSVCGGLDTGNYYTTGDWFNENNLYDGDWTTWALRDTTDSTLYINYTVPPRSTNNSLWQVKDLGGSFNLSISPCWNSDVIQLRTRSVYGGGLGENDAYWDCYSPSGWINLRNDTVGIVSTFEEAMIWDISSYVLISNITISNQTQNWTDLPEGFYFYRVIVTSISGSKEVNRSITLDTTGPNITQSYPPNNLYTSSNYINFTFNLTDRFAGIYNSTFYINDSITGLYNSTFYPQSSLNLFSNNLINEQYLPDGRYVWYVDSFDFAGNYRDPPFNLTVDSVYPTIDYGIGTENDGVNKSQTNVYVNITLNETNIANITYNLYTQLFSPCFQESANTTNQSGNDGTCALSYTGNYLKVDDSGSWSGGDPSNLYDGNWTSWLTGGTGAYLYINYTKPVNSTNAVWNVSYGLLCTNYLISIPQDCWDYNNNTLSLRVYSRSSGGQAFTNYSCYNGVFKPIYDSPDAGAGHRFCEEAITWESNIIYNQTIYTTDVREINWTGLLDNRYYYDVEICDQANQCNQTSIRQITLDTTGINITLISPVNNTFFNTGNVNLTFSLNDSLSGIFNSTFYLYNQTSQVNKTETTSFVSLFYDLITFNFASLSDGIYNWFVNAFDFTGNEITSENNTFIIDTNMPQINIIYPTNGTIIDPYATSLTKQITMNYTIIDSNIDICYYNINNGANITTGCGINTTIFNLSYSNIPYNITLYARDLSNNTASQTVTPTFGYYILEDLNTSRTFNETVFETDWQGYTINVSYDTTLNLTNAFIRYEGVDYQASTNIQGSNIFANVSLDVPAVFAINYTNLSFFWMFNLIDQLSTPININTTLSNQSVESIRFERCSNSTNVTYLNILFKDEITLVYINQSLSRFFTNYYLGHGTSWEVQENVTYGSPEIIPVYSFCFDPGYRTLNLNTTEIQYTSTPLYFSRNVLIDSMTLTNSTTNLTLYALSSSQGIYTSFYITDLNGDILPNVKITMERIIEGSSFTMTEFTDSSGIATFWVNPNAFYTVILSRSDCTDKVLSLRPTQASYGFQLTCAGVTNVTAAPTPFPFTAAPAFIFDGLTFRKSPRTGILNPGVYNFEYRVDSVIHNIKSIRLELISNGTLVAFAENNASGGINCSTRYCYTNITYNITDVQSLVGHYLVDFGQGYLTLESDARWYQIYINTNRSGTLRKGIQNIFSMFDQYTDSYTGETMEAANKAEFSRIVWVFLIMAILFAFFNKVTGYDSTNPGAFLLVMTVIIFLGSMAGGLTGEGLFYFRDMIPETGYSGTIYGYMAHFINNYILSIYMGLFMIGYWFSISRRQT